MGLTVAIIVVCVVALPIISAQVLVITDPTTKAIVQILPVFMVLGIMMAAVKMWTGRKSD